MTSAGGPGEGSGLFDLSSPRRLHIIGVGGSGMSAIAEVLIGTGHHVTGSDLTASASMVRLMDRGLPMFVGHDRAHLGDAEAVAISTAIPESNPELQAARESGLPILRRAELLAAITARWRTVAVAGTHGKTTTSAMLTAALVGAGLDPGYIVGGDLLDLGHGAAVGDGDLLVVEADESDGTFVELVSHAAIVTNVEPDHLEHYGGFPALEEAFVRFVEQCDGPTVVCLDDPGSRRLVSLGSGVISYGVSEAADWRITNPLPTPVGISFDVVGPDGSHELHLRQPGMHNARNATAALAMAVALGAEPARVADALSAFGGVGRRFEQRGQVDGITFVDDYAHLPTEVESALNAAKSLEPERVVAVFQPHRYSRTEQLWSTFGKSFVDADVLIITGIYSAGEAPRPGISGRLIADEVQRHDPDADVRYIESLDAVVECLSSELSSGDLCITLGAGDLTLVPDRVLAGLS